MEKYFCMECKFFGYDALGGSLCNKDDKNPVHISPYQVHTGLDCFRMKGE